MIQGNTLMSMIGKSESSVDHDVVSNAIREAVRTSSGDSDFQNAIGFPKVNINTFASRFVEELAKTEEGGRKLGSIVKPGPDATYLSVRLRFTSIPEGESVWNAVSSAANERASKARSVQRKE